MSQSLSRAFLVLLIGLSGPFSLTSRAADPKVEKIEKIEWRTDYAMARKESMETGLPLLVQIGSEDCFYCRKMESTTLKDKDVVQLVGNFIPLKIDANKDITLVKQLKVQLYPTTVLASSDGTIHAFIQGYVGVDAFKDQLKQTTDIIAAELKVARELLEVSLAMKRQDYAKAIPMLQRLVLVTRGKSSEQRAKAMMIEVEKIGLERLELANRLIAQGDRDQAIRSLNEMTKSFVGTEAANIAEAQLIRMGVDRVDRGMIASRATALLTAARDLAKAGAYIEALEIAELLDTSVESKAAGDLVQEIRSDPIKLAAVARQANDKAAELQLVLAEVYTAKGDTAAAVNCLETVVRLSPNTAHSEKATGRLSKLRSTLTAIPTALKK